MKQSLLETKDLNKMDLLENYQQKLEFLERENSKLKSVLTNELHIKEKIQNDHKKEIDQLMKYFEQLEQEKMDVEYHLRQNREEIKDLQRDLLQKDTQIDNLCSDKRGMELKLDDLRHKAQQTEQLQKKIEEVEDINNMIIDEKVKIVSEKQSMVMRVSQLEKEKEVIHSKLREFKEYNRLLFGKKNILGGRRKKE